jgi:chromosome segregation ATPase
MANENNNINELVADDDDPTAELEIPSFAKDDFSAEADAKTYDAEETGDRDLSAGVTVSELKSDLLSRKKTIGRLQYDIEQLHSKWLGLEAEMGARESQTEQLSEELTSSRAATVRKEKLIKKRDRRVNALKSEIRQRDDEYRQLQNRLDDLMLAAGDSTLSSDDDEDPSLDQGFERPAEDLTSRLRRTEDYADSIRQQFQDQIESISHADREIESLSNRLAETTQQKLQLAEELAAAISSVEELQSSLEKLASRHEEEIRILRFELGDAQNTVVQTEDMNNQLASDLVDAHGFKEELERLLGEAEEQSSERIGQLEKQVTKLTRKADSFEQKLTTKSEAISILLAELAKKSEQIDSIGKIEDVIHDIDERMSERSARSDQAEQRLSGDRISRVLIGTVDNQVLQFPLFKDRLTIGRTKENDIQLKAAYISRRHAVIQTDGDTTRIIDWGSKNGIQVNSARVSEHFLCHGDTIMIGNARFRYEERKKRDSQ